MSTQNYYAYGIPCRSQLLHHQQFQSTLAHTAGMNFVQNPKFLGKFFLQKEICKKLNSFYKKVIKTCFLPQCYKVVYNIQLKV